MTVDVIQQPGLPNVARPTPDEIADCLEAAAARGPFEPS